MVFSNFETYGNREYLQNKIRNRQLENGIANYKTSATFSKSFINLLLHKQLK